MSHAPGQRLALVGVLAGASLLFAACTPPAPASLSIVDEVGGVVCVPQESGTGRAVIALSEVDAVDGDVAVSSVNLVNSVGVRLLAFEMVDADFPRARLVSNDYVNDQPSSEPNHSLVNGRRYVVKVGLQADLGGGSADALALTYVGGSRGETVAETRIAMVVAAAGEACGLF